MLKRLFSLQPKSKNDTVVIPIDIKNDKYYQKLRLDDYEVIFYFDTNKSPFFIDSKNDIFLEKFSNDVINSSFEKVLRGENAELYLVHDNILRHVYVLSVKDKVDDSNVLGGLSVMKEKELVCHQNYEHVNECTLNNEIM